MSERDNSNYEELEKLAERYKSGVSSFEPLCISQDSLEDKIKEIKEQKAWDDYKEHKAQEASYRAESQNEENTENERQIKHLLFKFFLMDISITLPLIMMEAPSWLITLLVPILIFSPMFVKSPYYVALYTLIYNFGRPILYACGLAATIGGVQDAVAVVFYVITAVQSINIIKKLIETIIILIYNFRND